MDVLPYDPGPLPTRPAPSAGESISFRVAGHPPYKDISHSIRNVSHPRYESFVALRRAAANSMNGRAWYFGLIELNLTIHSAKLHANRNLNDYMGGIMDTLDGFSGVTFTYLPIVFEDDCQVCSGRNHFIESEDEFYDIEIKFMSDSAAD